MMIKKVIQRTVAVAMALIVTATLFSGCGKSHKKIDFIYPFNEDIESYDPQIASTADEFLMIENTFEGLIRVNDDQTVQDGCAESYKISDDGLTYTFKIKKGLKWDINTEKYQSGEKRGEYKDERLRYLGYEFNPEITADDFVFALQRACLPETNAPLFPSVSCIKNAISVNEGKMNVASLGVRAKDKHTLIIELETPDKGFLETLSSSIAMPCNRLFFQATKGRYGLEKKYTLFNGQFRLDQILKESYLLKKNKFYTGPSPAKADELTLKIINSEDEKDAKKTTVARLQSGYYDAAYITGKEKEKLENTKGITYTPYSDTTWVLLFNTNNVVLQSKKMRKAFCLGLSKAAGDKDSYLGATDNFIPASCTMGGFNVNETIGATVPKQNTEESIRLWKEGIEVIDTTDIELTIVATPEVENSLKTALQGIQSGLSTVNKNKDGEAVENAIKIEIVPADELEGRIKRKDYDIALYPYHATGTSPVAYLKQYSEKNRTGFDTAVFDQELLQAENAKTAGAALGHVKKAEEALLSSYTYFPLISETGYYATAKNVENIQFHAGSGRVSFVYAKRK